MSEKMLVTQALDERDLLVKKINSKIAKASFVDTIKPNEEKVFAGNMKKEDYAKEAEAAFQQIMDLIDRYQKIDAAIVASNASTFVTTSYGTYSVAGAIAIPFQTYYSASKAAINSYTMALANEVKPFGVQVCAVMPGDIRTGFTAAREKSQAGDDVYHGRIARSVAGMEHDEQTGMSPETAGAYIASVATRRSVKPLRSIGLKYKFFCVLAKLLPVRTLNWLVGLIYAK